MPAPLFGGKYELLREIATGGMAEVFLARQTGFSGFEKLVCIKRILPERAADAEFVQMFLDEARIAGDLRHPNIVDLYEIGEDTADGVKTLFLAMEYVHGHSVRYVQETAALRGRGIPRAISTQIALDAARGLHYAHTKKDLRGNPLGIVHRDVSPQNILLTFEGATKVCDFGIARAAGRLHTTFVGTVRGKVSYMSPEQATGSPLDARSDLFSLGVVLYELTTGMRLFPQADGRNAAREIVEAEIPPPSRLSADFPPGLEKIVMTLLARDPARRYATAAAAAAAIEDFLEADGMPASPARLAGFLREIFPANEREPDRVALPVPSSGVRTNLPADPVHFVGRAADLESIAALFGKGERLVTLLGPGGAGKTRLALRFAMDRLAEFSGKGAGGVWLADLTGARSADDILRSVADALGIPLDRGGASENVAHLGEAMARRGRLLLVLDNFEQVVEHGPATIGRWTAAAPEARFLVTSRERLRLKGEVGHEIPPLTLPEAGRPVLESEAVQLFVERARAVRDDFTLGESDAPIVSQIVRMLDGLPLAIELAASRMKVFTPSKLLERLPQRFELLGGARRDASDRQSTLRGAIDWSWTLLSPFEQAALAQASVFRGGFTLDAAEVVLDLSAWPGVAWVPDVVQALRDKSLLRAWDPSAAGGELRFGMYESIREYAAGKLAESGMEPAAILRHGEHYVQAGTAWVDGVDLHGGVDRLRRLTRDSENLFAAHRRAGRSSEKSIATIGVRAVLCLEPVFATRGPFGTFIRLVEEALGYARPAGVDDVLIARLLLARGWMRRMAGEAAAAREDFEASMRLAIRAGDKALEGRVLRNVGLVSWDEGRYEESRLEYAGALGIHRKAHDRVFEGRTLGDLANFDQEHGLLDQAQEKYEMAIAILREIGDRRHEGIVLGYLGALLQERARFESSRSMYDRATAIHREFRDKRHEAMFTGYLGTLLHERGDLEGARRGYRTAVRLAREIGDRRQEGFYLGYLGAADAAADRIEDSESSLDESRDRLATSGDRLLTTMALLLRGHLELAKARAKRSPDALAAAAQALLTRIRDTEAPGTAGWTGTESMRSLAGASMDIRLAIRLLRRALTP